MFVLINFSIIVIKNIYTKLKQDINLFNKVL